MAGHLISIELDSDVAERLVHMLHLWQLPVGQRVDRQELLEAMERALEEDDG